MGPALHFTMIARAAQLGVALFGLSFLLMAGQVSAAEDTMPAAGQNAPAPHAAGDISQIQWVKPYLEGNPKAPLQVTFYFTPYCQDCATSYVLNYPTLKKYVDQNLIRIRYQDLYYDPPSRWMVAFMHCLPQEHYLETLQSFYLMRTSARATDATLKAWADNLTRKYNIRTDDVQQCVNDPNLLLAREKAKLFARTYLGVKKVPAYLFGHSQERLDGTATPDVFETVLERLLAKKLNKPDQNQ